MNLFYDLLPYDLQIYVFNIINNYSVNTIIKYWYKYIQKKVILIQKIINLNQINPWLKYDSNIFFNASNILSGNEDYNWWSKTITNLAHSIANNVFSNSDINNYNLSICSCLKLAEKFNITHIIEQIIFII